MVQLESNPNSEGQPSLQVFALNKFPMKETQILPPLCHQGSKHLVHEMDIFQVMVENE